jgi:hypothetical protein
MVGWIKIKGPHQRPFIYTLEDEKINYKNSSLKDPTP